MKVRIICNIGQIFYSVALSFKVFNMTTIVLSFFRTFRQSISYDITSDFSCDAVLLFKGSNIEIHLLVEKAATDTKCLNKV